MSDSKVKKVATVKKPATIAAAKSAAAKPVATKISVAKPNTVQLVAKPTIATTKKPASAVSAAKIVAKPAAAKPLAKAKPAANSKPKKVAKKSDKKEPKKEPKKDKPEKVKMERDSFTMPKDEYAQIALLKARLTSMGQPAKKSELLRAGIKLLAAMSDNTLKTTLAKIPVIKTGRPNKKD